MTRPPETPSPHALPLESDVVACHACPRLVTWREQVAREKRRQYADEPYWGKAVPGFGDPNARVLIVGLAPAAHGANRTGRMFTGDRSGDWLYRALHKAGFASQPTATHYDDGLRLHDCYVTAAVHCAPPQNKPTRTEQQQCQPYLEATLAALPRLQVMLALGKLGYDAVRRTAWLTERCTGKAPTFGHGVVWPVSAGLSLVGSYHPSQQNTFTKRLTEPMFDAVFSTIRARLR